MLARANEQAATGHRDHGEAEELFANVQGKVLPGGSSNLDTGHGEDLSCYGD